MASRFFDKISSALSSSVLRILALILTQPVILASVLVTALLLGVQHLEPLQTLELSAFDQLLQLRPEEGPNRRILVVGITQKDLEGKYGTSLADNTKSVSDKTLNELLKKLEQYQPRVTGLDILRGEPTGEGFDDLVKNLQQSDRIIAVCSNPRPQDNSPGAQPPPRTSEDRLGFIDVALSEHDNKVRYYTLSLPKETNICPTSYSLGLQLALHYLKKEGIQPKFTTPERNLELKSTVLRPIELIDYRYRYSPLERSAGEVTLTEALKGNIESRVKDRIVLVGYVDKSKGDTYYTPYSIGQQQDQKMPGVIIHAQMVSQILSAVLDNRPLFWFWTEWGEALWIWGWSLLGGSLAWRTRHSLFLVITGGAALGALFGICYGLFTIGGWVPLVPSALALVATGGSVVAIAYREVPITRPVVDLLQRLSRSADSH